MSVGTIRSYQILKLIPTLLLLSIIGFSTYVWWKYGKTEPKAPPPGESRIKPFRGNPKATAVQGTQNIEYTHFDNGKKVYHVNASKTVMLQNGQQQLEDPEFIFFDDDEKEAIRVTGKHCNMSKNLSTITVWENTQVTSPNGMSVAAHQIVYDSGAQQFSTPAVASFHWQTLWGRSQGFTYKIDEDKLFLPSQPEIRFVDKTSENREPIVMTGNHGMIDRKSGFAFFEGSVDVTQGKDRIRAHRIEAEFIPHTNELQKITGIKDVHVKFARPGSSFEVPEGESDEEGADKAESKAPEPPPQKSANQTSQAQSAPSMANVFSADVSSGKDLDAQMVELYFYEDGKIIKSFHSVGDCTFVLHNYDSNDKLVENRIIKGQTFDATFNLVGDMQQFHANQDVSVKVAPIGDKKKEQESAQQIIFCDDLVADFIEATGDVKEIHFNDHFRHVQGTQTVSSDKAIYTASLRKTNLIGSPEIEDETFDITSNNMDLFEDTNSIHATGNVKSLFVQGEGKNPRTFPFSSPSKQPVYISAEDMQWNSQKSEATYREKAKLWQDKNVITAGRLVINDRDKTMSAYEKVHTIFYNKNSAPAQTQTAQTQTAQTQTAKSTTQAQTQSKTVHIFTDTDSESDEGPITVDAGIMNYADKDRIIHFEKDVRVVTSSTTINSDRTDFYLKEESSAFDRLYAMGKVAIVHGSKHGTGNEATFYNDDRKLILTGNPRLQETGQADIVGKVLTLLLGEDRILIDGQEDGRATTTLSMESGHPVLSSSAPAPDTSKSKKEKKKEKKKEPH
jgi:lipopolysaccharide export system protein LptA